MNRINWLAAIVWTTLGAAVLALVSLLAWAAERFAKAHGQWIVDRADWIFAGAVIVGVSILWQLAKKDNPTW